MTHDKRIHMMKIKEDILRIDPNRWWGDDYDVRFFLISEIVNVTNKTILDIGGGIGIISKYLDKSNFRINLDTCFNDLKTCKKQNLEIHNICASMTDLPFKNDVFDVVICSNILEVAKAIDLENNSQKKIDNTYEYPTIEKTLNRIFNVLKKMSVLYITTPNNEYYKGKKLTYDELKNCISNNFKQYKIYFFNSYVMANKKYRKLNFTNIFPKFKSKILDPEKTLFSLLKNDAGKNVKSVSFFVKVKK